MNIFYIIFGDKTIHHVQAYLSIRSLQKQLGAGDRITVVTTTPQYYRAAGTDVIAIDDDRVREWEGPHQFFWRVKLKAIEAMALRCPADHLMHLDTDTFLHGSLAELKGKLDAGGGLMHADEGHPSQMMSRALRMWQRVGGRTYAGITLGPQHNMWNAGVVAIPRDKLREVAETALALCDAMLDDGAEPVVVEQYALSIALHEKAGLAAAEPFIGHYWGNKVEWTSMAYDLMATAYMEGLGMDDAIARLDIDSMMQTPVYVHHSSTAARLTQLLSRVWKDKDFRYAKH